MTFAPRVRAVPPELRAVAQVLYDADRRQFPELCSNKNNNNNNGRACTTASHDDSSDQYGVTTTSATTTSAATLTPRASCDAARLPPRAAMRQLTTLIRDAVPLTRHEFRLVCAAYAACRLRLRGVPASVLSAPTATSRLLTLTTTLEQLCGEQGVSLPLLYPQLVDVHNYVLSYVLEAQSAATATSVATAATTTIDADEATTAAGHASNSSSSSAVVRYVECLCDVVQRAHAFVHDLVQYMACKRDATTTTTGTKTTKTTTAATCTTLRLPPLVSQDSNDTSQQHDTASTSSSAATATTHARHHHHRHHHRRHRTPHDEAAACLCNDDDDDDSNNNDNDDDENGDYSRRRRHRRIARALDALSAPLAWRLCAINDDVAMFFAPLRWCAEMSRRHALTFNSDEHLSDAAARRVWATYIGRTRFACTTSEFIAALTAALSSSSSSSSMMTQLYEDNNNDDDERVLQRRLSAPRALPQWLQTLVTRIVDYKRAAGVVCVYSVQRLLRVWGPLPLLVRNLRDDARAGVFCFAQPYATLCRSLLLRRRQRRARAGDFAAALTERPGEVRVVVLVRCDDNDDDDGDDDNNNDNNDDTVTPCEACNVDDDDAATTTDDDARRRRRPRLTTRTHFLTHEGGAWAIDGVVHEERTSVRDACAVLADTLRRPCGEYIDTSDTSERNERRASTVAPAGSTSATTTTTTTRAARPPWPPSHTTTSTSPAAASSSSAAAAAYALHYACYRNNVRYVQTLLRRGASTIVNCAVCDAMWCTTPPPRDEQQQQQPFLQQQQQQQLTWTPLLCAVNNADGDCAAIVQQLLDAGADAAYADESGSTALYYAIANGYADATRVLLAHCTSSALLDDSSSSSSSSFVGMTSPATLPLLVALGAHHFHARASDVRRLADVLPSRGVVEALMPHTHDAALLRLALRLLHDKIDGVDRACDDAWRRRLRTRARRAAAAAAGVPYALYVDDDNSSRDNDDAAYAAELRTPEEQAELDALVHAHTLLCQRNERDMRVVCNIMARRCYLLSWRAWLRTLDDTARHHRHDSKSDSDTDFNNDV